MTILCVVLIGMAWWGIHNATSPIGPQASAPPSCTAAETSVQKYVKPGDVTVSVYNAGARNGFAGLTLRRLERRGFQAGEVANAPAGVTTKPVATARVLAGSANDAAARLVARNLGTNVTIEVTTESLGPGVDVLVGKHMGLLNQHAPSRMKLPKPITSCVKVN